LIGGGYANLGKEIKTIEFKKTTGKLKEGVEGTKNDKD